MDEAGEFAGLAGGGVDAVADIRQVDVGAVGELARRPLGVGIEQGTAVGGVACQRFANGNPADVRRVLSIGQQMRRGCGVSFHQQRT